MTVRLSDASRRAFMAVFGKVAASVALATSVAPVAALQAAESEDVPPPERGDWDLSWVKRLSGATDRAVFDWPGLGDPADPTMLFLAERYLDNCRDAYGDERHAVRTVLNIRTQAVPAALSDAIWARFHLGVEYNMKDPSTSQAAERNPFLHRSPSPSPDVVIPMLPDLMQRGAIVLACDFALRNLAKRLAGKLGSSADEVHAQLREGLVDGAFAVPSGIFGLARAQNAGCALIRQ